MIMNWQDLSIVLSSGLHAILYGPPGTGKTTIAATEDCYQITLTAETPAAELRGHYIPHGQEFIWHDGPAIRAWREGKRLVLNEINEASGDALIFLYGLLDDPAMARITLPTGEHVTPAKGFQTVATTNAGDLHAVLPAGLLDRFSIRVCVDAPHPDALARLPEPLANAVKATILKSVDEKVTMRQALAFHTLNETMQNTKLAAQAVWGNRAPEVVNSMILALAAATEDAPTTTKWSKK